MTAAAERTALIISHAHPDFSKGGAEVAAHGLFTGLNQLPGWNAYLLARHGIAGLEDRDGSFYLHRGAREILFKGGSDPFYFSNRHHDEQFRQFVELLHNLRPDVVHFHHYWNVGVEWLLAVKRHCPGVPVVVTLHEYLAICLQNGQMLKSNGQLCHRGSPALCHSCLPQYPATRLFLREHFLKSFFSQVDLFVSPSHFLKQRYVDWGLPAEKIEVRENGQQDAGPQHTSALAQTATDRPHNRFAYFGQINEFKGLDILLEAFAKLPEHLQSQVHLEIHGNISQYLPDAYKERLNRLLEQTRHNVRHFGPYSPEDQHKLMAGIDYLVVPSIWWENSPMVIQEAFIHGKPVICADIGGMAEKVQDKVTGLHFRARNALDLARVLELAATTPGLWQQLSSAIRKPPNLRESAAEHAALYQRLMASPLPAA